MLLLPDYIQVYQPIEFVPDNLYHTDIMKRISSDSVKARLWNHRSNILAIVNEDEAARYQRAVMSYGPTVKEAEAASPVCVRPTKKKGEYRVFISDWSRQKEFKARL